MKEQPPPLIHLNSKIKKPIHISLQKLIFVIVILVLFVGNFYFGFQYFSSQKELKEAKTSLQTQQTNNKILEFTQIFIKKVLQAETEVDFETRLKLENAVRNLGDEEILAQWQKFTESKTEVQAQEEVKNLLEMLISKIKAQ